MASFVLLFGSFGHAWQAGIDKSFGALEVGDSFNIGSGFFNRVKSIAVQNDGKMVIVGNFNLYNGEEINHITRLNVDGSRDASFLTGTGFQDEYSGYGVESIALQNDGKMIVGGSFTAYNGQLTNNLIRLNANGSKDASFDIGSGFNSSYNGSVKKISIQNDGKILVGGQFSSYNGQPAKGLVRLNADGSRDSSFIIGSGFNGGNGSTYISTITIQNDGKILIGGQFEFSPNEYYCIDQGQKPQPQYTTEESCLSAGFCYDKNGTIEGETEQSCINNGYSRQTWNFSWTQIKRKNLIRLNTDGSIDSTFAYENIFHNLFSVNDITIQSNGKIIVGGVTNTMMASFNPFAVLAEGDTSNIFRLNADGSIDNTFIAGAGFLNGYNPARVSKTLIQNDGKIIVIGVFSSYNGQSANGIRRLNTDGSLDTSFNVGSGFTDGGLAANIYDIHLLENGKIIVGGEFSSYSGETINNIIQLNADGTNNTNLKKNTVTGFDDGVFALTIQNDGKIIVGGRFTSYNGQPTNGLVRLNTNGSIDSVFDIGSGFNDGNGSVYVYTTTVQNDGKILVGGQFYSYNGQPANGLVRLNTDGTKDSSFDIGDGFDDGNGSAYAYTTAIQNDGKILVGGGFTSYNGDLVSGLVRLNADGTRDASFDIGSGFNDGNGSAYIYTTTIQNDGKIIVGGQFSSYNGQPANGFIRLNIDGSRDNSFDIGDGFNDGNGSAYIYATTIQNDGKILVAGQFSSYNGQPANGLVRLNTDGSIDSSFGIGSGFDDGIGSAYIMTTAIQDDRKILVGGRFTSYNGQLANNIIRLNADGSRDNSFDIGDGFDNEVDKIVIENDGGIFVGGYFTSYNEETANYIVSLIGNIPVYIPNSSDLLNIKDEFNNKGYEYQNVETFGDVFFGNSKISLKETSGKILTNLHIISENTLRLSLPQNLQFKKSDSSNYNGIIYPPTTYSVSNVDNKPILSAISVGSPSESLTLTNGAATLGIPAPTSSIGDPVSIYSSQNGVDWIFEKGGIVSEIDGQSYVSFTTNHFTYFAIAGSTGSFVINNDEASTLSQSVNLTIAAPTATGMRFSNNGIIWSDWEPISTTKSWVLSEGYSEKTISAQFIANGDIYTTSDSILYTDGTSGNGTSGNGTQGNISLTITGGVTECVYGTSLTMDAQEVKIGIPYTFTGILSFCLVLSRL
ncbi:hypothetical protein P148_SR1C00001G1032 [candidate division SR1 bacterium RAAC1_SR1_1]|nr:hypothetical protein P148_SR1C00001G1032 [candidate division SR1 bacterium RAAC1_SR1_1]